MAAGIVSNDLNRSYAGDAAATGGAGNSGLDQVGFFLHTGYCECDDPPQPQPPMVSFDFSVLPSGQSVLTCPDLSCDLHDVQI